jgi:NNP family nitrate/nitrite transporter-like MFS transporter
MKLFDLKNAGHWPTLLAAFLSPRGAEHGPHHKAEVETQIGEKLNLSPEQKGLMVALPILAGAACGSYLGY